MEPELNTKHRNTMTDTNTTDYLAIAEQMKTDEGPLGGYAAAYGWLFGYAKQLKEELAEARKDTEMLDRMFRAKQDENEVMIWSERINDTVHSRDTLEYELFREDHKECPACNGEAGFNGGSTGRLGHCNDPQTYVPCNNCDETGYVKKEDS